MATLASAGMAIRASVCIAAACCGSACQAPPAVVPTDAPAALDTIRALARLEQLHIDGLVELSWSDDSGRHVEQGDLEVWFDGKGSLSMRVTKFGDVIAWSGWTPTGWFSFDMYNEPSSVLVGDSDVLGGPLSPVSASVIGGHDIAGRRVPLSAQVLRRLWGLAGPGSDPRVEVGQGKVVVHVDRGDDLLEQIELSADGSSIRTIELQWPTGERLRAVHRLHERGVQLGGRRLARYIDLTSLEPQKDPDKQPEISVLLARVNDRPEIPEVVFDVDRLLKALRPERFERATAAP